MYIFCGAPQMGPGLGRLPVLGSDNLIYPWNWRAAWMIFVGRQPFNRKTMATTAPRVCQSGFKTVQRPVKS